MIPSLVTLLRTPIERIAIYVSSTIRPMACSGEERLPAKIEFVAFAKLFVQSSCYQEEAIG